MKKLLLVALLALISVSVLPAMTVMQVDYCNNFIYAPIGPVQCYTAFWITGDLGATSVTVSFTSANGNDIITQEFNTHGFTIVTFAVDWNSIKTVPQVTEHFSDIGPNVRRGRRVED